MYQCPYTPYEMSYCRKWDLFQPWALGRKACTFSCSLAVIFEYLCSLIQKGLSVSSGKIHMAVIPTFHYEVQRIATQDIAPVVFIFSAYLFDERPI